MIHILVIGIRSENTTRLRAEYGDRVSFKFLTDQHRACKKVKGNFDYILSCVRFSNHTTEENYSSHQGYRRVQGGFTSLKRTLDSILESQHESPSQSV